MLHRRVRLLLDRDYRVEPATSRRWKLVTACLGLLAALLALDGHAPAVRRDRTGHEGPAQGEPPGGEPHEEYGSVQ